MTSCAAIQNTNLTNRGMITLGSTYFIFEIDVLQPWVHVHTPCVDSVYHLSCAYSVLCSMHARCVFSEVCIFSVCIVCILSIEHAQSLVHLQVLQESMKKEMSGSQGTHSPLDLLRTPTMRTITISLCFVWSVSHSSPFTQLPTFPSSRPVAGLIIIMCYFTNASIKNWLQFIHYCQHSSQTSLINKAFLPTEQLLTGCFFVLRTILCKLFHILMVDVNINWSSWPVSAWLYALHSCYSIGW